MDTIMHDGLSSAALAAMAAAEAEARRMKHHFIGTEHILLGVLQVSRTAMDAVTAMGANVQAIRNEIDRLVAVGSDPSGGVISLTPRARQAVNVAKLDMAIFKSLVEPEHLLVGVLRDPLGVAGLVIRNLGIDSAALQDELFKIRFQQMKLVERVIRPLKASIARKRKMREELVTHLCAIYDQERSTCENSILAMEEAAKRFGNPEELTRELQSTLPRNEWIGYLFEQWMAWRPKESVVHYLFRLAVELFVLIAAVCLLLAIILGKRADWDPATLPALRPLLAVLLITPLDQFLLGIFYFKARDAMFGVFGSRRSRASVSLFATLIGVTSLGSGLLFVLIDEADIARVVHSFYLNLIVGMVMGAGSVILAMRSGPIEITDTIWATLDVN